MPCISQDINHIHQGESLRICGANHSAKRQFRADEFARSGKDEVGLQRWVRRGIEVREGKPIRRIDQRSDWRLHAIAREIHLLQEVRYFVPANAEQDSQNI